MENKKPYVNYAAKSAANQAKTNPVKDVAVNAQETVPPVIPVTEEVVENKSNLERVDDIAEKVTVKFVNVASLNVRSTPSSYSSNIVGQLKKDDEVNVIEEVGEFSKIGEKRYVMTKYLI